MQVKIRGTMARNVRTILKAACLLLLCILPGIASAAGDDLVSNVLSTHLVIKDNHLIWSEYSTTPIQKMPKGGGGPITPLVNYMGGPINLAIHDGYIIWIEAVGNNNWCDRVLNKTSLDGATNTVLAQGYNYFSGEVNPDMVVHDDSVYWVVTTSENYIIQKIPLVGGEATPLVTTSQPIRSLVRDDYYLYWVEGYDGFSNHGAIKKMPLEGGEPVTIYSAADNTLVYGVMAVAGEEIVFGDLEQNEGQWRLMKILSSGGPTTVLAVLPSSDQPRRIIIEGSNIYWADQHSVNVIPLGGGERSILADNLGYPQDIAVAGANLFWTEKHPTEGFKGSIKRMPVTGGAVAVLAGNLFLPRRFAIYGSELYFVESYDETVSWPYTDGRIAKISQNGGAVQTIISGATKPLPDYRGFFGTIPFTTDYSFIYFADADSIKKVPISGGVVEKIDRFAQYSENPQFPKVPTGDIQGIATDGEFVYFNDKSCIIWKIPVDGGEALVLANYPDHCEGPIRIVGDMIYWAAATSIKKINKNGGSIVTVATDLPYISDLIVDREYIYFSGTGGKIYRISVNGGSYTTISSIGLSGSWNILTLDHDNVYVIDQIHIGKARKDGGESTYVVPGGLQTVVDFPSAITLNQNAVYWTEPGAGMIKKMSLGSPPSVPPISITFPTSGPTYDASSNTLTLGGTASDDVGVTEVTWVNSLGGRGTATGTISWSVTDIALQSGSNVITVTVRDAAGNAGTSTITVNYDAPPETSSLYTAFTGVGLFKYDGTNWTKINSVIPSNMAASGTTLYTAFTGVGLFKYDGSTWTKINKVIPASMVTGK